MYSTAIKWRTNSQLTMCKQSVPKAKHCVKCRHEIFPEIRNFHDLRGHSRGNRRSDLIFMGGGGGGRYHIFCVLAERQQCWNGTP